MENVSIVFKYSPKEYTEAFRQWLVINGWWAKIHALNIFFMIIFCSFIMFGVSGICLYISIIPIPLLSFMILWAYYYVPVRNFKAEAKFKNECHLVFSKSGIEFISDGIKNLSVNSDIRSSDLI